MYIVGKYDNCLYEVFMTRRTFLLFPSEYKHILDFRQCTHFVFYPVITPCTLRFSCLNSTSCL